MDSFSSLRIHDFDHLQFAVADLDVASQVFLRLGFERIQTREILERKVRSYLLAQNNAYLLLTQSGLSTDPIAKFVQAHGDGVVSVAFRCEDALATFEAAVNRGAAAVETPKATRKDFGTVQRATIQGFGDVWHTFISREGNLFGDGFETATPKTHSGYGLSRIDHVTCAVERGELGALAAAYEKVLGLQAVTSYDIHSEAGGKSLAVRVLQSPDGIIRMPVHEPSGETSNVQDFLDVNHGPGVQHVALETSNMIETTRALRKEGVPFIEPTPGYYETVMTRVPQLTEDLRQLEDLGILVDASQDGYSLHLFTKPMLGPLFFEIIQRKR